MRWRPACAAGAMLAWARRRPAAAGALIGIGGGTQALPAAADRAHGHPGAAHGPECAMSARRAATAVVTWFVVNLPVMVLFPRGWSEFFRLNTRRGDDMDSIYNVVKSFTGWRGFDPHLGLWQPPSVTNAVTAVLFAICLCGIAYVGLTAKQRPAVGATGIPRHRGVPPDEQGVESPVLAVVGGRWRCSRCLNDESCWRG